MRYTVGHMKSKLIQLPNGNLRKRSQRVGLIDQDILDLIEEMKKATLDWEDSRDHEVGVALAAIQININKRVVIIRSDFNNKKDKTFEIFINPKIAKYEGEVVEDFEGCLSVNEVYGKVPRHSKVRIDAKDINNKDVRITAKGFLARVFQHEIDHTNGMLFVDRIKDTPDAFHRLDDKGNIKKLDKNEQKKFFNILW